MEFKFKNFGKAGNGTIGINDLTIICGPNNTGKTYLNYAIYSILKNFNSLFNFGVKNDDVKHLIEGLKTKGAAQVELSGVYSRLQSCKTKHVKIVNSKINKYFQLPEKNFNGTEISVILNDLNLTNSDPHKGEVVGVFSEPISFQYKYENEVCSIAVNFKNTKNDEFSKYFVSDKEHFTDMKMFIEQVIFNAHFAGIIPVPFSTTSERTGISIFYKAYDFKNSQILQNLNGHKISTRSKVIDSMRAHLAEAIADNVDSVRIYENIIKDKSFILENGKNGIIEILNGLLDEGSYEFKNDSIYFLPPKNLRNTVPEVPIYAASSSAKSLFFFDLFIKHLADKNSILVIDEPELNLFVEKQVLMAKLVSRLVNSGIKVLVTTHSDYFIREINNLIALNQVGKVHRKRIMQKYDFSEHDLLKKSQISAYATDFGCEIKSLKVHETGIDSEIWNKQIEKENIKTGEIYNYIGVE